MRFLDYLKDKIIYILLIIFAIISIQILLLPFRITNYIKIYIAVVPVVVFAIPFFIEYYIKNRYYKVIKERLEGLDERYLISELLPRTDFSEGKLLEEITKDISKSMIENVNKKIIKNI